MPILFLHTTAHPAITTSIYPLSISPDNRWLIQADGQPFYINGDAAWSMGVNLSRLNVTTYLSDRAARGINTIVMSFIEHKFSDNSPAWRNTFGDLPFTGTLAGGELDFTTPNEAYWANIDFCVTEAQRWGITVLATPAYVGFQLGNEGWGSAISANGTARMTTYGTFIGNRYKNFPNIIWVIGGDNGPVFGATNITAQLNAFANAIKAADPKHLMTAHPAPNQSAFDAYNQPWLDINTSYTDANTGAHIRTRLSRQQVAKPTFLIESPYGNEHSMTSLGLRIAMYQPVLAGAIGHVAGSDPMWYFGTNSSSSGAVAGFPDTPGLDWHNTLNIFGADAFIFVKRLQKSRPLINLLPDYSHTVVTAGYDPGGTEGVSYAPVMANNQMLVAYTNGNGLTVNKAQFVSATFNVRWYNVRDGSTTNSGTASFGSGSQLFTPPDTNDWVLLLDNQSLGLGSP